MAIYRRGEARPAPIHADRERRNRLPNPLPASAGHARPLVFLATGHYRIELASGGGAAPRAFDFEHRNEGAILLASDMGFRAGRDAAHNARALQSAVVRVAGAGGGTVIIPPGGFRLDTIWLRSGVHLQGCGRGVTVLRQNRTAGPTFGMLHAESPNAEGRISGLRLSDLTLRGMVETKGFSEFEHLVSLNGVHGVLVERVDFVGFRGDGLYIGSGASAGHERHNRHVVIRNCTFDGVNKNNRNGISIIDGDGVLIERCAFKNCTRADMPGAIDVEPDANVYHVVRNITVQNCSFRNIGGGVAAIGVMLPGVTYTTAPGNFMFERNRIDGYNARAFAFVYNLTGGISDATANFRIRIVANTAVNGVTPFALFNARGATVADNIFDRAKLGSYISYSGPDFNALDISVRRNRFARCGTASGVGLSVFTCDRVAIEHNLFEDCGTGKPGASNAISFDNGTSSNVALVGNIFRSPAGMTHVAVQKEASHRFRRESNWASDNDFGKLLSRFEAARLPPTRPRRPI
jgi:hypothetical protein